MWPFSEFFAGLLTFVVGVSALAVCIRFGRIPTRLSFALALVVEVLVILGILADWGYSWFNRTALDIALNSNVWVALPHALALMVLIMTLLWGPSTAPWAVFLVSLQTVSFLPVIFLVELDTDTSFLSVVPLSSMYASVLAAFLLLPQAWSTLPREGSRWFSIAFGPRTDLIRAIRSLSDSGFVVHPPETVLDSGSASGRIGETEVLVTTRPSLIPPAYALRIQWVPGDGVSGPPPSPGLTPSEWFLRKGRVLEYVGRSGRGFRIPPDGLFRFLSTMTLGEGVEKGMSSGRNHS